MAVDMEPREFNYGALFMGVARRSPWETPMNLRSECLRTPIEAFLSNLKRASTFASMPAEIAYRVRRDQLLSDCATFNTTGKVEPNLRQFLDGEPSDDYKTEFEKLAREHFSKTKTEDNRLNLTLGLGVGYIERMLDESLPMRESMDATFEAVILQSWTAFECLTGDLWVSGVDNEPGEVVSRLIYERRRLKNPDDNVRPETVYRTGINPKTHYGSFLRAIKSVAFQTLTDIKKYYGIAFGEEFTDLFDAIDAGYVEVLAAFRNAITHNSGRADRHFISQIARFRDFSEIRENDRLQLEGGLVLRLRNVASALGRGLIEQMDELLTPKITPADNR